MVLGEIMVFPHSSLFYGDNTQFGVNLLFKTKWLRVWGFLSPPRIYVLEIVPSLATLRSYCSNAVGYCFILESHFSLFTDKSLVR